MGTRGRKSGAALATVVSDIQEARRPKPPKELTDEQATEWRAVVDRMPGDYFGEETFPLLVQYCRHVVSGRRVHQLVKAAEENEDFDVADYDRLLKMQERESRCIGSLATKMRLAQSNTYDRQKIHNPPKTKRPWEDE